jgi:hypothetical protein
MTLVYFRGWVDLLIDDKEGRPNPVIKAEDRGNFIQGRYEFYRPCDRVEGAFKLTDSDEKLYKTTGVFKPDKISRLSPCSHPDSIFTKMAENGKLPEDVLLECYFNIVKNRYRDHRLNRNPHLIKKGKLDFDLYLYKSISDESETTPNNKSITAILIMTPIT